MPRLPAVPSYRHRATKLQAQGYQATRLRPPSYQAQAIKLPGTGLPNCQAQSAKLPNYQATGTGLPSHQAQAIRLPGYQAQATKLPLAECIDQVQTQTALDRAPDNPLPGEWLPSCRRRWWRMTSRLTRRSTSTSPTSAPLLFSPPHPRVINSPSYSHIPVFPHPVQWHVLPPRSLILARWAPNRRPNIGT